MVADDFLAAAFRHERDARHLESESDRPCRVPRGIHHRVWAQATEAQRKRDQADAWKAALDDPEHPHRESVRVSLERERRVTPYAQAVTDQDVTGVIRKRYGLAEDAAEWSENEAARWREMEPAKDPKLFDVTFSSTSIELEAEVTLRGARRCRLPRLTSRPALRGARPAAGRRTSGGIEPVADGALRRALSWMLAAPLFAAGDCGGFTQVLPARDDGVQAVVGRVGPGGPAPRVLWKVREPPARCSIPSNATSVSASSGRVVHRRTAAGLPPTAHSFRTPSGCRPGRSDLQRDGGS